MKIKNIFVVSIFLITLFGIELYQYIKINNIDIASATSSIPNPGHTWSSMECNSDFLCLDNTNKRLGIGTSTPVAKLDIRGGGLIINSFNNDIPTCDSTNRGLLWAADNNGDNLFFCSKSNTGTYFWKTVLQEQNDFVDYIRLIETASTYSCSGGASIWEPSSCDPSIKCGFASGNSEANNWIKLTMNLPISISKYEIMSPNNHSGYNYLGSTNLYASLDNSTWVTLASFTPPYVANSCALGSVDISDTTKYKYFKITLYNNTRGDYEGFGYIKFTVR